MDTTKEDGRKTVWRDPAYRERMSKIRKAVGRDPKVRAKMSKARLGKKPWNAGLTKETDPRVDYRRPSKFVNGDNSLEKHPRWKGGISKIDKKVRTMKEYLNWREEVFERDEWTCQTCRSNGCYVTAHHIKSFASLLAENEVETVSDARKCEELWDVKNGVTLCEKCHSLTDNYRGRGRVKNGANSVELSKETIPSQQER